MSYTLWIANKLRLGGDDNGASSPILNIATIGISLAIVVMLLSISIVSGFKEEITHKIYSLDAHVKVYRTQTDTSEPSPITVKQVTPYISKGNHNIKSLYGIAEKEGILKTDHDFEGIVFRGVGKDYDTSFLKGCLKDGRMIKPSPVKSNADEDTAPANTEVMMSTAIAQKLSLKTGDNVLIYFIGENVRVRKLHIVGLFSTDFNDFDSKVIIGDQNLIAELNQWSPGQYSYIAVTLADPTCAKEEAFSIYDNIMQKVLAGSSIPSYGIENIQNSNVGYFAWLDLLDMNIVIILILMSLVSGFTLIAGLVIIVLQRTRTIGTLKSLGATNSAIRRIFILLTVKLIVKALILGNVIALALIFIQDTTHICTLSSESYYMSFVPVSLHWQAWLLLNVCVIVFAYITLLLPSYIISRLKPSETMAVAD